jgi:GNAT superfamily N-acetyltransferase
MKIRPAKKADKPFMKQMLFEAFFWHPDRDRPDFETFIARPGFRMLLARWGRSGDRAVIAEEEDEPVGAAWFRLWTVTAHSYGFVNAETPELGMGVRPGHRSKGIGRALLRALIETARNDGFRALSLSVAPEKFARQLYASEGFAKVGESGTSWTMLLRL